MRYGDLMIEENGFEDGNYDNPGGFLGFSGPLDSDEVGAPYRDLGSIAESPAASVSEVGSRSLWGCPSGLRPTLVQ